MEKLLSLFVLVCLMACKIEMMRLPYSENDSSLVGDYSAEPREKSVRSNLNSLGIDYDELKNFIEDEEYKLRSFKSNLKPHDTLNGINREDVVFKRFIQQNVPQNRWGKRRNMPQNRWG